MYQHATTTNPITLHLLPILIIRTCTSTWISFWILPHIIRTFLNTIVLEIGVSLDTVNAWELGSALIARMCAIYADLLIVGVCCGRAWWVTQIFVLVGVHALETWSLIDACVAEFGTWSAYCVIISKIQSWTLLHTNPIKSIIILNTLRTVINFNTRRTFNRTLLTHRITGQQIISFIITDLTIGYTCWSRINIIAWYTFYAGCGRWAYLAGWLTW